ARPTLRTCWAIGRICCGIPSLARRQSELSPREETAGERDQQTEPAKLKEAAKSPVWQGLLAFWIVTRVWLSFLGILCSALRPFTPLEKRVAAWPPSSPIGEWIARLLLAPWDRWDAEHFQRIAEVGYRSGEGTLAFQPLFPYLGKLVGEIFGGN